MRRSDREIKDSERINEIIQSCDCCRLGFIDINSTYIVPLNFGFTVIDNKRILYFHGAKEGKKIELIKANANVGFELDTNHGINRGETACSHSYGFLSIIGKGTIGVVDDEEEKKEALRVIMKHYSGKDDWVFDDAAVNRIAILKLAVTELSCKEHE